jgi:hypothetical protein
MQSKSNVKKRGRSVSKKERKGGTTIGKGWGLKEVVAREREHTGRRKEKEQRGKRRGKRGGDTGEGKQRV